MNYTIEIATDNYASTASAVAGGASRIELCSALSEGGLTPGYGYLLQCRKDFQIPLFPIIRPRAGDFLYSTEEFTSMQQDVLFCRRINIDGIVTGFLQSNGSIDIARTKKIVELAKPMQVTFHRAFDRCRDPFKSLEDIIEAGCHRILTSGQQQKAPDGSGLIAQLIKAAAGRLIIMPGSGVRKENIASLARQTGATEFHSSLRCEAKSPMQFVHPSFACEAGDYTVAAVDPSDVEALLAALAAVS